MKVTKNTIKSEYFFHALGGWGATMPPQVEVRPKFRFTSLAKMAVASAKL